MPLDLDEMKSELESEFRPSWSWTRHLHEFTTQLSTRTGFRVTLKYSQQLAIQQYIHSWCSIWVKSVKTWICGSYHSDLQILRVPRNILECVNAWKYFRMCKCMEMLRAEKIEELGLSQSNHTVARLGNNFSDQIFCSQRCNVGV
jgi:hypothetical protein